MGNIQRGLVEMFHDFDRRARPGREPKNRAISKFQTLSDTVQLSSDTVTTSVVTPPYQYARQSYQTMVAATTGLISYWRLGEYAPAVTANDDSTNNHGTYVNTPGLGTTGAGLSEPNLAVVFTNGSSQYVTVPDAVSLRPTNVAVEAWVKTSSTSTGLGSIVVKPNVAATNSCYGLHMASSGTLWMITQTQSATTDLVTIIVESVARIDDGNWHHCVGTATSSAVQSFVDGTTQGSLPSTNAITYPNLLPLFISAFSTGSNYFPGAIDEVAVYSIALKATTVLEHYNAMTTPTATGFSLVVGAGQFR